MKHIKRLLVFVILFLAIFPAKINAQEPINVYFFHSVTCPHCAEERVYLEKLVKKYTNLDIHYYEVSESAANEDIMVKAKKLFGYTGYGVPFTIIGNQTFVGYASYMNNGFEKAIKDYVADNADVVKVLAGIPVDKTNNNGTIDKTMTLPLLGVVNVKSFSLPLITAVIGTLDGFNPCAMWVLLFLISMLLGMNDRKRMWILGVSFLATSAIVYFLVMLAWINLAATFNTVLWIRTLIAFIAIGGGFINLRGYLKKDEDGCEVVDDKKRKRIFERVKDFTTQKSFLLALAGVIALAISVNVIELACSAGLPLLFTQILSLNHLSPLEYFLYTTLYIFFFLLDDLIVFSIAMVSLKVTGVSTKYGKYSKLIGGILMLIIGTLLLFKPEWIMLNF